MNSAASPRGQAASRGQSYVDRAGNIRFIGYGEAPGREFSGMCLGTRTKEQYPYSYDPHLQWSKQQGRPAECHVQYSDRLIEQDARKFYALCERHFGDTHARSRPTYKFDGRSPPAIEAFLRDFMDCPTLELVRIEEHCSVADGYPTWAFFVVDSSSP